VVVGKAKRGADLQINVIGSDWALIRMYDSVSFATQRQILILLGHN
jgi:hypothetical protein